MSNSINIERNVVISEDRDTAVQTALTGSTVYALPKWTAKRNLVDQVLMIMDEDGPEPMINMKPTKKARTAADQFYDHHGEYEAMGQTNYNPIEQVHTHNNACPKMYDELDKRRSLAQVGTSGLSKRLYQAPMSGVGTSGLSKHLYQAPRGVNISGLAYQAPRGTPQDSSSQDSTVKFCPDCPKCNKRKKRVEQERKRRNMGLCEKCRQQQNRRESKNKLSRVTKQKTPGPRKQQSRCRSYSKIMSRPCIIYSRPCIMCSNKCFQCHLATETKSVSTFKSSDNLLSVPQDITMATGISIKDPEKIVLKSTSSHKKKIGMRPGSTKSDVNSGQPDTETGPSVSTGSYNTFLSTEQEPMIE